MSKKLSDMTVDEMASALKEQQLNSIDKQLKFVSTRLDELQPLIELRDRLQAARRALLNERAVASGGGRGLSQAEVVNALQALGIGTVYEIAQKLGANESAVRAHLNRGKDERFKKDENNRWYLREPEEDEEGDDE